MSTTTINTDEYLRLISLEDRYYMLLELDSSDIAVDMLDENDSLRNKLSGAISCLESLYKWDMLNPPCENEIWDLPRIKSIIEKGLKNAKQTQNCMCRY